jgi:phosphate transport system protein
MTREAFHRQLETLTATTVLLGEQAIIAVSQAVQAFVEGDSAMATRVVDEDEGINRLEHQILDDATDLLTLQAPVASDLRRILGISRVASHLERIGDYARDIARETPHLAGLPSIGTQGDLPLLIDAVTAMLRDGLRSFAGTDAELARSVCLMDDGVDSAYAALFRDLLGQMVADAAITARATHTLFAAHDLERIGDHMANICETVIYIATGQTVELN